MREVTTMDLTKPIDSYWENFKFSSDDLDFLYNYLLEREEPLTDLDLAKALIQERIRVQREVAKNSQPSQKEYFPKETYQINDILLFPKEEGKSGKVIDIRDGKGISDETFKVMTVIFSTNHSKEYVMEYENHPLNQITKADVSDCADLAIFQSYGKKIAKIITDTMDSNEEIVCIGGKSFPKALLIDINAGYLNLAEALLEMEEGGPLSTSEILKNIEFPSDDSSDLVEFSMNYALQEDPRFDEVGPSGETLWYSRAFEPEYVKNVPVYLKSGHFDYQKQGIAEELSILQQSIFDEWEFEDVSQDNPNQITVHLIFPHCF